MKKLQKKLFYALALKQIFRFSLCLALSLSFVIQHSWAEGKETLKIGAILSVTGPASFLGDPELKTLEYYTKKINDQGGIDGRTIELIAYDSGGSPKKALTFIKRLISQDEVHVLIGPSTTGESLAISDEVEAAGLPMISLAGAVVVTDPVKPYIFKTPPTDKMVCVKLFEHFQKRGYSNIAMISGTGGFGKSMQQQCLNLTAAFGLKVLANETYDSKDTDMSAQLTKIKNTAGVQAVLNPGFGQGPAIVTKNYRDLALPFPFYQSHGVASKNFIKLTAAAGEGVFVVGPPLLVVDKLDDSHPLKNVSKNYKDDYESAYSGLDVSSFGGHAYDAFHLVLEAVRAKNSIKSKDIRDGLEEIKGFVGPDGVFNFSASDHLGLNYKTSFLILRIENGDWTIVK